jgi:hypothetical protein
MESFPPSFDTAKFNTSAFLGNTTLTLEEADKRYLKISSGRNLYLIDGITPGIAQASKALIFDSSINITNINSLTSAILNTTTFNVSGNATYSGVNSNILFSGNSSLINMTGSASKITLTGNNTSIELTGVNGHIDFGNTANSTNINTGAIRSAGGGYFGGDSVFNTKLKVNGESTFNANLNISTSKLLILDSANHNYLSSDTTNLILDAGNNANSTNKLILRNTSLTTGALVSFQTSYLSKLNISNNSNLWNISTDSTDFSISTPSSPDIMYFSNSASCIGINTITPNSSFWMDIYGSARISNLCLGDSSDTSRIFSALDSTLLTANAIYMTLGKANQAGDQAELSFNYVGVNSASNYLGFGFYGGGNMFKIYNSGKLGINTSTNLSNQQIDINSSTGNNLRLLYNNTTSVVDLNVSSTGAFNIYPFNNEVYIKPDTANGALYIGQNIASGSAGIMRFVHSGGVSYLQTGANNSSNSTSDFFIGSISQGTTTSNRKFMIKSSGLVGIQSYNPTSQLEINASGGNNLKLSYNNSAGTATQYSTFGMGSAGTLTLTAVGTTPLISLANLVGINSTNPQQQLEINSSTGANLQLSYNNSTGTATQYSRLAMSSIGGLTVSAIGTTPTILLNSNTTTVNNASATDIDLFRISGNSTNLNFHYTNTAFGSDNQYMNLDSSHSTLFTALTFSTNGSYPILSLLSTQNSILIGAGDHTTYTSSALLSVMGSTYSKIISGYLIAQDWSYKNQSPKVDLQISTTLAGASYIGTSTSTDFGIMAGNSSAFYINGTTQDCMIGTKTDNNYPLNIARTTNITIDPTGTILKAIISKTAGTYSSLTTFTNQPCSLSTAGSIVSSNSLFILSDKRTKEKFADLNYNDCLKFMKNINSKRYYYKRNEKPSIGFVAQDVLKTGFFNELINIMPQDSPELIDDDSDDLTPDKHILILDYQSIIPIHHKIIQELLKDNDELIEEISNHTDYIDVLENRVDKLEKNIELIFNKFKNLVK